MALATILARADGANAPAALLAYERLRRERVAQVQRGARENGLRYNSAYADLGIRDAEIAAHAAFRKRLYDHDVVPEAQAAAELMQRLRTWMMVCWLCDCGVPNFMNMRDFGFKALQEHARLCG